MHRKLLNLMGHIQPFDNRPYREHSTKIERNSNGKTNKMFHLQPLNLNGSYKYKHGANGARTTQATATTNEILNEIEAKR